mmetsp:Transcript_5680/g.6300  ORF Transcript_5680/g.6300 Transcript_5680/m.6300 type:complete len:190 (+) Transcript_5680:749-1318(+)
MHLMAVQKLLSSFAKVPQLYTILFPPPATSSRDSERTKSNNTSPNNQNGGGSSEGSGGSNKGGDDNSNSRSQGANSNQTKSESPDKDTGIFIVDKMSYFKCVKNKDGVNQPQKVTVDCKLVTVCLKGPSRDRVCINKKYTVANIFVLDKFTDGVSELNTWALDNGVKWSSQKPQQQQQKQNLSLLKIFW